MATSDLATAMRRADHWLQLGWGEAWAAIAQLLEPHDPQAARRAWAHAADGYEAYADAHAANMPSSRFSHDYGPEAYDARARASSQAIATTTAAPLPAWIEAALASRFDDAVAAAPALDDELARAVGKALGIACSAAGRRDDAARLWPSPPPA